MAAGVVLAAAAGFLGFRFLDSKAVFFSSDQLGGIFDIYRRPLDRSQPEATVLRSGNDKLPQDVARDGRSLLFTEQDPKTDADVWLLPLADGTAAPLILSPASEGDPRFSPDTRWLAYTSDESGRRRVYVQSYPQNSVRLQVSRTGGESPVWSSTGGELFFIGADSAVMSVELRQEGTEWKAGMPKRLFDVPKPSIADGFEVSPDGQRFLFAVLLPDPRTELLTVALNWLPRSPAPRSVESLTIQQRHKT